MAEPGVALISIKPQYAEAILAGRKSVELRRRIPFSGPGMRLFIYSTMPVGAVIGSVTLESVVRDTPVAIWDRYGPLTGVNRSAYDAYFQGTDQALGLILKAPQRVPAVGIAVLRTLRAGFHPPQVMVRLSDEEAEVLENGAVDVISMKRLSSGREDVEPGATFPASFKSFG